MVDADSGRYGDRHAMHAFCRISTTRTARERALQFCRECQVEAPIRTADAYYSS
jgi:ribosomal protein L37AE/L43A